MRFSDLPVQLLYVKGVRSCALSRHQRGCLMPPQAAGPVSRSNGGGTRLEVVLLDGMIAIRESNNPASPVLSFKSSVWRKFLNSAKSGEFDHVGSARRTAKVSERALPSISSPQDQFVPPSLLG